MLHYVKFSYCAYVIITELDIIVVQKQQIKMKAITKTSMCSNTDNYRKLQKVNNYNYLDTI